MNFHFDSIYFSLSSTLLEKFLDPVLLLLYLFTQSGLLILAKFEIVVVGLIVLPLEPHKCFHSIRSPKSISGHASRRLLDY